MKKYIIGIVVLSIIAALTGAGYYYYITKQGNTKKEHYRRDPSAWEVPPVVYSMKGKTFMVPDMGSTTVTLNLITPSATHDYPMGEFEIPSSTTKGELTALDSLVTNDESGLQAVPIAVSTGGSGTFYYLAILTRAGDTFTHTGSLFLGDRLDITSVTRAGSQVTVVYKVHGRNQAMTDEPEVTTTAIVDIASGVFVQEGRKPSQEEDTTTRQFVGKYLWKSTTKEDGTTITPSKPDVFTLQFDGPRAVLGTDCNTGSSEMKLPTGTSTKISFGAVAATKMFCSSTEEGPYFEMFGNIVSFTESNDGTLTFNFADKGTMVFVPEKQKLEFESTSTTAVNP